MRKELKYKYKRMFFGHYTHSQDKSKELKLEHICDGVISITTMGGIKSESKTYTFNYMGAIFNRIHNKYNHKWKMTMSKFLGKHHIKIPKCTRSRIRGRA